MIMYMCAATLTLMAVFSIASADTQFVCGDADGEGTINVADLSYLVSYLFLNGPAPDPYLAGDCDEDGEVNVADLSFLVNYLFLSGPAPCSDPSGGLVYNSGCKYFGRSPDTIPPDLDCVFWEYDGGSHLTLDHVNTAFNCCPEAVYADVYINGDTIRIVQSETFDYDPCPCLCLYDLTIEVINLSAGQYTIIVEQMYLWQGDSTHTFTIDLTTEPSSGENCIYRSDYPWGDYQVAMPPIGQCQTGTKSSSEAARLTFQDCINWSYDGSDILSIAHTNALFNCCPSAFYVVTGIVDNVITIEEQQYLPEGGCDCVCLFNIDYDIRNVIPGQYLVRVIEPYFGPPQEPMEFTIDLTETPSTGSHCIER